MPNKFLNTINNNFLKREHAKNKKIKLSFLDLDIHLDAGMIPSCLLIDPFKLCFRNRKFAMP